MRWHGEATRKPWQHGSQGGRLQICTEIQIAKFSTKSTSTKEKSHNQELVATTRDESRRKEGTEMPPEVPRNFPACWSKNLDTTIISLFLGATGQPMTKVNLKPPAGTTFTTVGSSPLSTAHSNQAAYHPRRNNNGDRSTQLGQLLNDTEGKKTSLDKGNRQATHN